MVSFHGIMECCFEIAMHGKSTECRLWSIFMHLMGGQFSYFKNSLSIGTNATLPTWTMNDLLQINGNETKANTSTNSVTSPLKRASLRSRTQQSMTETNGVTQTNHKRPSTHDSSINKRLKSNSTVSSFSQDTANSSSKGNHQQQSFTIQSPETVQQQQKSPHLLQHLMAPSPERIRKYNGPMCKNSSADKLSLDQQWTCNGAGVDVSKIQSSDSVLKNLLVSGCDISAGYICHVPVRLRKLAKA